MTDNDMEVKVKIGEWLGRYAAEIKNIDPGATGHAAFCLALTGLASLVDADVVTATSPEGHAAADVARLTAEEGRAAGSRAH